MSAAIAVTAIDLLLQFIDRTSAAAAVVKKAHEEGRQPTGAELAELRGSLDAHLSDLDAAIAQAKAEGR
jgi:hypothetical protein